MMLNRTVLAALLAVAAASPTVRPAAAQGTEPAAQLEPDTPPRLKWSFAGPFGKYDEAQLQRGFKVYDTVCKACHGLKLVAFRNLADPGGPGFSVAQAGAIAAQYQVQDGPNDQGEMFQRAGTVADRFPPPFPNEQTARLAYGAAPPDLSVIAKARTFERGFPWFLFDVVTQYQEQGPDYIAALLKGFVDPPPQGVTVPQGAFYNKYFPGHTIRMRPPLKDGDVQFDDGAPATLEQYSQDVAAFLMWAAEPTLDARKRLGFQVMIFLIVLAGLLYFTKKQVWHDVELHPDEPRERPAGPGEYGSHA
jgi:ubiquinol-cytochrome c reductase cytochrome b/c1 subunit